MKTEQLNYYLPPELIAQQPADKRSDARLLVFDRSTQSFTDTRFSKVGEHLQSGDCLVLNNTKVLPARFFARRQTGAKLQGLFLAETQPGTWQVYLKGARKVKNGEIIHLKYRETEDFIKAELIKKTDNDKYLLKVQTTEETNTILEKIGFPPLPPYIKRSDDPTQADTDKQRYQTVYAKNNGAVAAPTAGLHFTEQLIEQLKKEGIIFAFITLHTSAGTFKPVTAEHLEDHKMHAEQFSLNEENARIINLAKAAGRRIIAVGTTSVRTLETITSKSQVKATSGATNLFITPGYKFKIVDAMLTNFHLPKSTLLALVTSFAGLENTLAAYNHAIEQKYRFYSYGDAMLIT